MDKSHDEVEILTSSSWPRNVAESLKSVAMAILVCEGAKCVDCNSLSCELTQMQIQMVVDVIILQSRGECRLPASIWLDSTDWQQRKRSRHVTAVLSPLDGLRLSF